MQYVLDLMTLMQLLSRQRQNGELQADRARISGVREHCQVSIQILRGAIHSCVIRTASGKVVAEGEKAVQLIWGVTLEWDLLLLQSNSKSFPSQPNFTPPVTPPATPYPTPRQFLPITSQPTEPITPVIPVRVMPSDPGNITQLSRAHRKVFSLIDGQRSIDKIASLLSVAERAELADIMNTLHSIGVIEFKNRQE